MEIKLGKRVTHLLFEKLALSLGATSRYTIKNGWGPKITVVVFNLKNKVSIDVKYSQGTVDVTMRSNTGIGGFELLPEDTVTIISFLEAVKSLRSFVNGV